MNKKKSSFEAWTFLNHRKCSSIQVPDSTLIQLNLDPLATAAEQRLLRDSILWCAAANAAAAAADDTESRAQGNLKK
jgi:hypothetical protein